MRLKVRPAFLEPGSPHRQPPLDVPGGHGMWVGMWLLHGCDDEDDGWRLFAFSAHPPLVHEATPEPGAPLQFSKKKTVSGELCRPSAQGIANQSPQVS